MRYILDDTGYIDSVSCTPFNCKDKSCKEYTGTIPEGYSSLKEWAMKANIRAYKIDGDGNLEYNELRDSLMQAEWLEYSGTRNIITGYLAQDVELTSGTNTFHIPLTEKFNLGNKLSLNNDGDIVVGAGVTHVLVSSNVRVNNTSTSACDVNLYIYKNGEVELAGRYGKLAASTASSITASPQITEVNEGDILSISVWKTSARTGEVQSTNNSTFLTVEVL